MRHSGGIVWVGFAGCCTPRIKLIPFVRKRVVASGKKIWSIGSGQEMNFAQGVWKTRPLIYFVTFCEPIWTIAPKLHRLGLVPQGHALCTRYVYSFLSNLGALYAVRAHLIYSNNTKFLIFRIETPKEIQTQQIQNQKWIQGKAMQIKSIRPRKKPDALNGSQFHTFQNVMCRFWQSPQLHYT